MLKCTGCKYWSEMIAKCDGGGPVVAMCLSSNSPKKQTYTLWACDKYEAGEPVDMEDSLEY